MQESGLKVNQPASFAVSLNGAKGVIDAKVHSPSGALEECCVTEIDEGNHGAACTVIRNGLLVLHLHQLEPCRCKLSGNLLAKVDVSSFSFELDVKPLPPTFSYNR